MKHGESDVELQIVYIWVFFGVIFGKEKEALTFTLVFMFHVVCMLCISHHVLSSCVTQEPWDHLLPDSPDSSDSEPFSTQAQYHPHYQHTAQHQVFVDEWAFMSLNTSPHLFPDVPIIFLPPNTSSSYSTYLSSDSSQSPITPPLSPTQQQH